MADGEPMHPRPLHPAFPILAAPSQEPAPTSRSPLPISMLQQHSTKKTRISCRPTRVAQMGTPAQQSRVISIIHQLTLLRAGHTHTFLLGGQNVCQGSSAIGQPPHNEDPGGSHHTTPLHFIRRFAEGEANFQILQASGTDSTYKHAQSRRRLRVDGASDWPEQIGFAAAAAAACCCWCRAPEIRCSQQQTCATQPMEAQVASRRKVGTAGLP